MGAIVSKSSSNPVHVMPLYYTEDSLTPEDATLVVGCWKHITDDTAPGYLECKRENEAGGKKLTTTSTTASNSTDASSTEVFDSALAMFYTRFYDRLFDVHPSSRPQFKNSMVVQGRALVKMISAALSLLNDPVGLTGALEGLARGHAQKGVMSFQYGIVGEVLLTSLETVLGKEIFNDKAKTAWVRLYSFMLKVIIPVALVEEKRKREEEVKAGERQSELSSKRAKV